MRTTPAKCYSKVPDPLKIALNSARYSGSAVVVRYVG